MPDINDLNTFLKADSCETGDTIRFLDAGKIFEKDFTQKDGSIKKKVTFEITVLHNGEKKKTYSPNATSNKYLKEAWGSTTERWVNRLAEITIVNQLSFGEMKKILVARPMDSIKQGAQSSLSEANAHLNP